MHTVFLKQLTYIQETFCVITPIFRTEVYKFYPKDVGDTSLQNVSDRRTILCGVT